METDRPSEAAKTAPNLEPEDYYFEGPYMVFTAAYHRKRGYCCDSGCRHCPYRGGESTPHSADRL